MGTGKSKNQHKGRKRKGEAKRRQQGKEKENRGKKDRLDGRRKDDGYKERKENDGRIIKEKSEEKEHVERNEERNKRREEKEKGDKLLSSEKRCEFSGCAIKGLVVACRICWKSFCHNHVSTHSHESNKGKQKQPISRRDRNNEKQLRATSGQECCFRRCKIYDWMFFCRQCDEKFCSFHLKNHIHEPFSPTFDSTMVLSAGEECNAPYCKEIIFESEVCCYCTKSFCAQHSNIMKHGCGPYQCPCEFYWCSRYDFLVLCINCNRHHCQAHSNPSNHGCVVHT